MTPPVLLGDYIDINSESISKNYPYDEILYLDTSSVTENIFSVLTKVSLSAAPSRAKRIVRDSDTVISTVRPNLKHYGYIKNPEPNTVASTGFAVVRPKPEIDSRYLYYWLTCDERTNYFASIADSQTSTFPAFNPSIIQKLKIDLPELFNQKQVAIILSSIDEKIELNRRMNETLEQMGQALFRHYFIDSPEAKTWPKVKFSELTDVSAGKGSTKSKLATGGQYPLYGANGIMGTSDEFLFNEPIIITGRVGSLGNVRIVNGKCWLSDNVLFFRPRKGFFGFVYSTAKTFDYVGLNRGSTQPLITQTDIKNQAVTKPDAKVLQKFEEQFSVILEKIQKNDSENQNLAKQRDYLLPRLISGKIKV